MFSNTDIKPKAELKTLSDFVLVGEVGCGKTALMKALLKSDDEVRKTQAAEYHDNNVIDTPGEFIGRPAYYGALLATVVNVGTIVYLQPANSTAFTMPAGLLQVYPNKRVIGVITKSDLPDADSVMGCRILEENGIKQPYFITSTITNDGVEKLRCYLANLQNDSVDAESLKETSPTI